MQTGPESLLEYLDGSKCLRGLTQVGSSNATGFTPNTHSPKCFFRIRVDISVTILHVASCLTPVLEELPRLSNYKVYFSHPSTNT
jgi:hypothetical protein